MCPAVPIVLLTQEGAKKFGTKHITCSSAEHRGLASWRGILWQCHISGFFCVALISCRQSNVIYQFSLLFPMKWCLQCVVVKGGKARKAVKKGCQWIFPVLLCTRADYKLLSQLYQCFKSNHHSVLSESYMVLPQYIMGLAIIFSLDLLIYWYLHYQKSDRLCVSTQYFFNIIA